MSSGEDASGAPTEYAKPSPSLSLPHRLELNIPLPSVFHAQTLYRVISVDKPLRPKDTHIAFRITPASPTTLDISLHTSSVRQLRMSSNAVLDDVSLILETMDAFPRAEEEARRTSTGREREEEFELSGTGRAG